MSFDPGIASMHAAGIPATERPYAGTNAQQIHMSLETMAQLMRQGAIDAGVRGWALECFRRWNLDGRDARSTPFRQAAALLEDFRASTSYAPDPYAVESISAAATTLCLRPNLCVRGGDCDDLTVAYGSLCLSVGIPVQIVKQSFGPDAQDHVLCAVFTGDDWHYADPSTDLPLGSALQAADEQWIDPMGPVGPLAEQGPRIVTLGRPRRGVGQTTTTGVGWTLVTDGSVVAGKRYRMGVLLSYPASVMTVPGVKGIFSEQWVVESAAPTGDVTGGIQSWVIQGVARNTGTLTDSQYIKNVALAVETPAAITPTPGGSNPPAPGLDAGTLVIGFSVIAIGGGIAWYFHRHHRSRRR